MNFRFLISIRVRSTAALTSGKQFFSSYAHLFESNFTFLRIAWPMPAIISYIISCAGQTGINCNQFVNLYFAEFANSPTEWS